MLGEEELLAWLRLTQTPGVGDLAARRLLAAFGSPQAALSAGAGAWREVAGHEAAAGLAQPVAESLQALFTRTAQWLHESPDHHVLTWGDADYPAVLLQLPDPPPLLYAVGQLRFLRAPCLAMVGSRHATPQGRDNARHFAAHFSRVGLTVVSGLALGVDGAAHDGALEGPGSTIAVVGTGLDQVYPRRHVTLAARVSQAGLLLSEFPLGTPPLSPHFPKRNRIIAGLSMGTLVVEAAVQSGSLITARLANEFGREVFAIPGSIHSPQSRGCHRLIQQGAKLVETAEDVLQELPWTPGDSSTEASTGSAAAELATPPDDAPAAATDSLLAAMGHDPVTLDALIARCGWPAHLLSAKLLEFELTGQVARLPGGLYQRRGWT
jgi:DNA processing protein